MTNTSRRTEGGGVGKQGGKGEVAKYVVGGRGARVVSGWVVLGRFLIIMEKIDDRERNGYFLWS